MAHLSSQTASIILSGEGARQIANFVKDGNLLTWTAPVPDFQIYLGKSDGGWGGMDNGPIFLVHT